MANIININKVRFIKVGKPTAKFVNYNCVGGLSGTQQLDIVLKDNINNPLTVGDIVEIEVTQNNILIERLQGVYGDNINTFNSLIINVPLSLTNFSTGNITDGGTISIDSYNYSTSNALNCDNNIEYFIFATDTSQSSSSNNIDNNISLPRILQVNLTGTIPVGVGSGGNYAVMGTSIVNPFFTQDTSIFIPANNTFYYVSTGIIFLGGLDSDENGMNILSGNYPTISTNIGVGGTTGVWANFSEFNNNTSAWNKRYVNSGVQAMNNYTSSKIVDTCNKTLTLQQLYAKSSFFSSEVISSVDINIYQGGNITPATNTQLLATLTGAFISTSTNTINIPNKVIDYSNFTCGVYYIETLITHQSGRILQDIVPIVVE